MASFVTGVANGVWTQRAVSKNWDNIASSSDGTKLIATAPGSIINKMIILPCLHHFVHNICVTMTATLHL